MALVTCPTCSSDDIHLDEHLGDGRKRVRCGVCNARWTHGDVVAPPTPRSSYEQARSLGIAR